jgi:hypothetical protein
MCFSAFVVKGVESRQTNVGDFFLRESNCRVRRQSVARRTNGRSGRAARQRQRPSYSQYRYGCPTLSLRISLAMRHGGGFPFHPHLNVPLYTNDGHKAVFERWIGTCGAGGSPNVRITPKSGHGRLTIGCPLCANSGRSAVYRSLHWRWRAASAKVESQVPLRSGVMSL